MRQLFSGIASGRQRCKQIFGEREREFAFHGTFKFQKATWQRWPPDKPRASCHQNLESCPGLRVTHQRPGACKESDNPRMFYSVTRHTPWPFAPQSREWGGGEWAVGPSEAFLQAPPGQHLVVVRAWDPRGQAAPAVAFHSR